MRLGYIPASSLPDNRSLTTRQAALAARAGYRSLPHAVFRMPRSEFRIWYT